MAVERLRPPAALVVGRHFPLLQDMPDSALPITRSAGYIQHDGISILAFSVWDQPAENSDTCKIF